MKRNTVVIETDNGERFEVKFNPWRKVILVTNNLSLQLKAKSL